MTVGTQDTSYPNVAFHAAGLIKVYRRGAAEVAALRDIDLDLYGGE